MSVGGDGPAGGADRPLNHRRAPLCLEKKPPTGDAHGIRADHRHIVADGVALEGAAADGHRGAIGIECAALHAQQVFFINGQGAALQFQRTAWLFHIDRSVADAGADIQAAVAVDHQITGNPDGGLRIVFRVGPADELIGSGEREGVVPTKG